jgi:hypothetical protein
MTGNAVRGAGVAAERSEIGNGVSELALSLCKPNKKSAYRCKADFCFHGA